MNIVIRMICFVMSLMPSRSWPQEPHVMKIDRHVELLDIEDIDSTQAQIDEIKKQIQELQERFKALEHTNPLRRVASSPNMRDGLLRSTKD